MVGGAVGNAQDRADAKKASAAAAAAQQAQMHLEDIASMTANGISDTVIINQIRTTGSVFHLTPEQITWLRQQRVSDAVVTEMQATAMRYPQHVYGPPPGTVVVVEQPPPPPPVGVGIGVAIRR
jgi:hypothetical protein